MNWELCLDRAPQHWARTQLRSFLTRSRERGRPGLPLLSVNLQEGVVPRREGDGRPAPAEDLSAYQVVRRGDLVMNQLGKPHGALGVSQFDGIISPAYFVARIGAATDPQFVHHLLRTRRYISEYERRGKFMPPSQFDISWDQFRTISVALPPPVEQRAIADFLDTETARIDALVAKKRLLIDLLAERMSSAVDELVAGFPTIALRRVADTLAGFTFPSETFGPAMPGPRLLRGVNVAPGFIRWDDCVRLARAGTDMHRYELVAGDIVLGMDRPFVGGGTRVAVVDESSAGTLLVQRVCRIRAQSQDYAVVLRWALGSPAFRGHVEADLTGVSVPHLSEEQISSVGVPDMTSQQAAEVARRIRVLEAQNEGLRDRLTRQIMLLLEHRLGLITAAVTGEMDVAGAAA